MVHEINWHFLFHEMSCVPRLTACGLAISIPFGYFNCISGHVIPGKVPKAAAACHSEKSELAMASLPAHLTTQLPRISASQPIGLGHGDSSFRLLTSILSKTTSNLRVYCECPSVQLLAHLVMCIEVKQSISQDLELDLSLPSTTCSNLERLFRGVVVGAGSPDPRELFARLGL